MYVHSLTSYLWRCISDKHLLFTPNKNEVMVSFILQNSVKEISFMCGKWMLFGLLIFSTNLTVHQSLFMQWSGCICLVLKSSCGINLRKFRMKRIKKRKKIGCALSPLELQIKRSIHDRTEIWFIVSKDTHFLTHFFGAYSKQIHDITWYSNLPD